MKKKTNKIFGIILCALATILLLLMFLDFSVIILLICAFCYFVGIKCIRDSKRPDESPSEAVIVTPELTITSRNPADTKSYSYSVYGVRYENENGQDIQRLLAKLPAEGVDSSELYNCMTNSEIKDEFDEDDKVYIFDGITYDADLVPCEFDGAPAVKVYFVSESDGNVHIGWISKKDAPDVSDMIQKHDCSYSLEIEGGKYKHLEYDDEEDKYKVVTESGDDYFARVYISYPVDAE